MIQFRGYQVTLKRTKYVNSGNLAIIMTDKLDGGPVVTATVNTEDKLDADLAYIKDYSENEGMLDTLQSSGVIIEVLGYKSLGYVEVPLVRVDLSKIDEIS